MAEFPKICGEGVRSPKKNPAKIGRELINQGASTNLVSGSRCTCSGQLGKIWENLWLGVRSPKKNPKPKLVGS
ncbi:MULTISPECIES: hypothetical protein [unclassified Microcoleus]|uniref:hypothetical protein n=1 Tax=unclassified Microcoleus TaxID=2642155 RepID=UPI002FD22456